MHRNIVPSNQELTGSKRAIGFLPSPKQISEDQRQDAVQLWEPVVQQHAQVNALRIIVKLSAVHRESWWLGEWHRMAVRVEQGLDVIADSALDGTTAFGRSRQLFYFCEGLQNKTGMKVIDKISHVIYRVVPGAICVLRFDDKVEISIRSLLIFLLREIQRGLCEEKCPVGIRIDDATGVVWPWAIATS